MSKKEVKKISIGDWEIIVEKEIKNESKNNVGSIIKNTINKFIETYLSDSNLSIRITKKNNTKEIISERYFDDSVNIIKELRNIISKYRLPPNLLDKLKTKIDDIVDDIENKLKDKTSKNK